ncbi:ATP-binding cassette domain-containing protein [Finegoldia magna]|uniref:Sugar ABC transporter ATP-binding protein n=1 Tax=Finegoldia magna TaxID=1260 RepID=A0A233VFB7_FINMA|nr:ATP-binding cassette domain-containing protein [Finegoldia magna]MDU6880903.1 ATP-binding cassette domain-containing protein [Finegoldia magna]OXZ31077.1 sugar ABC transporter ATP-binding protein [Finegoldia magna]
MIIRRINHKYKNFELDIENLEIGNNKIIGLIGENGAGKTTLMDILSKMIKANASFDVQDYNENDTLYIPSQVSPYYFLTVSEFCKIVNEYSPSSKTSEDLIVELGLEDKKDTLISELSEGMKKKLTLINILTGDYSLIIMDEPFNSIDLKYSYEIKKLILQLKENSTILISSHILDSLIDICDEFVLLKNGNVKKVFANSKDKKQLEDEIFERNI